MRRFLWPACVLLLFPLDASEAIPESCRGWQIVSTPDQGWDGLNGVAAISANNAWAVGSRQRDANAVTVKTLLEHWNGGRWRIVASPNPGTVRNAFTDIEAIGADDIWAVGVRSVNAERVNPHTSGLAVHWNGSHWTVVSTPHPAARNLVLEDVDARSPRDVWAVGSDSDRGTGTVRPLIEHWNGRRWRIVRSPDPPGIDAFLTGVASLGSARVFAVGTTEPPGSDSQPLAFRWNGTGWGRIRVRGTAEGALHGVAASSTAGIWAVGVDGSARTLIVRWNGSGLRRVPSPTPPAAGGVLSGVATPGAGHVWSVGGSGSTGRTLVEKWNGINWQIVASGNEAGGGQLQAVDGASADDIWSVGSWDDGSGSHTLAEHYCPRR